MNIKGILEINFETDTAITPEQLSGFSEGLARIIAVSSDELNSLAEDIGFGIESIYPITVKDPLKIVV